MSLIIAICDDNKIQVESTKQFIENTPIDHDIEYFTANSGEELLDMDKLVEDFDIIFLDIEMDGLNGIETAGEIRKTNNRAIIVFITGFKDYALEAYELNTFHYLLKPISQEKISELMTNIIRRIDEIRAYQDTEKIFTIKTKSKIIQLPYNEIYYFEKILRRIKVIYFEGDTTYTGTISTLLEEIDNNYFIRCHQGFIVNRYKISKYKNDSIYLRDIDKIIPVSRSNKENVIKILKENLFSKG